MPHMKGTNSPYHAYVQALKIDLKNVLNTIIFCGNYTAYFGGIP